MNSTRLVVRPAQAGDLDEMSAVLGRSGLSSVDRAVLEFYLASSVTRLFVAGRGDPVTGVAGCVAFGRTGWLGSVAVDPDARGQGLGTAVSEAALDWLRQAGVATVLLTATELGQPIYTRLGFVDEGVSYGIWERAQSPVLAGDGPGLVQPGRIEDVLPQDAEATGEDRRSYLTSFADRCRAPAGQERAGYRVALPWGGGPVVATCAAAARALLVDMFAASPAARLAFPAPNVQGAAIAVALGFRLARRVRRMRLGPPVPGYRPEVIYNVFSLAAG